MSTPNNQNQQYNQPAPGVPMGQGQKKKSGLPCGLIAAGCGCLTLILLVALGVGGFFMYSTVSSEVGGITELIETISDGPTGDAAKKSKSQTTTRGKKGDKGAVQEAKDEMEAAISPEKIRSYMKTPLTKKDIREQQKFLSEWEKNPVQQEYVKSLENVEKLKKEQEGKEGSITGNLRNVNAGAKILNSMNKVTTAFDEHIRKSGGYEKYYSRVIRIGGVVAASQTVVGANKKLKDPDSDAVAKQMLKERPEIANEYRKNFEDAKKEIAQAKKSGTESAGAGAAALMSLAQGPGTVALARMPEQSFKTWAALSTKERKAVRDSMQPKAGYGGWFGLFSVNPAALLVSATMSELQELSED
ncbi:hypothetical protein [Bradymonas sediminis]|uniref:Uncharacterized protein n=1 Tax=Bradymonas sediminis TaxID=1548548 RepID=A0A2Z4FKD1_9DELT|nr:hypothetical protein [Bradymonas sediminis]AWV89412.1 hypothetical protein DN745_08705 [Bradymonas sediminis]TDP73594.1 hypothetical protein DFR33_106238 [Bradymonas sediminis]